MAGKTVITKRGMGMISCPSFIYKLLKIKEYAD
jgi:hypothetical protein